MFVADLQVIAIKGRVSTEPLVGDNREGVLITCSLGKPLQSLRGEIDCGPWDCHLLSPGNLLSNLLYLDSEVPSIAASYRDAEITQGHIVRSPGQHILWLDIVVDDVLIMGIL